MTKIKESIAHYRYSIKDPDARPILIVTCAACGTQTVLNPQRGEPENAPWILAAERRATFQLQAESEYPPTEEEEAAAEVMKMRQREFEAAKIDMGVLLAQIRDGRGEGYIDDHGELRGRGRNEQLIRESEELIGAQQAVVDEAGLQLVTARKALARLENPRIRQIDARYHELEQEDARKRAGLPLTGGNSKGAGNVRKRLREVLGR